MRAAARGIFFRHVLRAVAAQVVLVAAILLAVLVIYQFSFVMGRAADGQIPGATVPRLVLLSLRSNLGVILPFAVLLGAVLALGRLYYDSEITAAQASGMPRIVLYLAAGAVVLPVALLAGWIAFFDAPAAAREAAALRLAALRTAVTRGLEPGSFRAVGEGITLHFRDVDADGTLRDVFIQRELPAAADGAPRLQVVLAERARYSVDPGGDAILVNLFDGQGYQGSPGALDWRLTSFREQLVRLPVPRARLPGRPRVDGLANRTLLASVDPRYTAELHWRIGWVASVLVLGLLAVPLARVRPRQGRHARVPLAVLLFALHAGLLTSGRTLLERGETNPMLGLWWTHALVIALGLAMLGMPRLDTALSRWRLSRASP
ncbi:MAG: LPS export ABC transporter permease LptF [Pseudomonadota bacterium]|nr:LPS export ABC transporter permease LptF [Pseudomonadota bacterium]